MVTNESSIKHVKPGSGAINRQRRTFIGGALTSLLASSSRRALPDDDEHGPNDPFLLLLHRNYEPVPFGQGPAGNLGLTTVNLSDGSFSKTQVYPIFWC